MSTQAETAAGAAARTLVVERVFKHSPQKLWRALTETDLLTQWMMANDFAPQSGHKFQFRTDPKQGWNGIVDGEVLIVEPPRRLSYSWGVGKTESSPGMQWTVLWTLTPVDGGTHVRMEQSGFSAEQQANYNGARYGWKKFMDGLDRVLGGLE